MVQEALQFRISEYVSRYHPVLWLRHAVGIFESSGRTAQRGLKVCLALGLVVLGWWEGGYRWSASGAHWSVATIIAVTVLTAVVLARVRWRQGGETSTAWLAGAYRGVASWLRRPSWYGLGVIVWVLIAVVVAGWDLHSFLREVHQLPTLSYLIGRVTRFRVGRMGFFLAWLVAGWYVVAARPGSARPGTSHLGRDDAVDAHTAGGVRHRRHRHADLHAGLKDSEHGEIPPC